MLMPRSGSSLPMAALCTGDLERSAHFTSHTCQNQEDNEGDGGPKRVCAFSIPKRTFLIPYKPASYRTNLPYTVWTFPAHCELPHTVWNFLIPCGPPYRMNLDHTGWTFKPNEPSSYRLNLPHTVWTFLIPHDIDLIQTTYVQLSRMVYRCSFMERIALD